MPTASCLFSLLGLLKNFPKNEEENEKNWVSFGLHSFRNLYSLGTPVLFFLWPRSYFSFHKKQKPKQFVTPFFMGRQCQAHRQLAILQTGGEKLVEYLEMYLCIWGILCPLPNTSIIQMPTDFDRPPPPRCGISIGFLVVLFLLIFVFNSIFSFISFFYIFLPLWFHLHFT